MVGITPDPEYQDEAIALRPGDRLYFFSDGILEQLSPSNDQFGNERLFDALRDGRAGQLDESVDRVIDRLSTWAQRDNFDDDLSLLAIEWSGQ